MLYTPGCGVEGKRIWVFHVFGICIHVDLILIEIIILLKKGKKKIEIIIILVQCSILIDSPPVHAWVHTVPQFL